MSLATDPFTGNRYAFAGGNPISFVELDGHLFGLSLSDIGHATLDVVGLVPVVGEVADVANGIWYAAEGNYVNAALSLTSAIPLPGYAATAVKAGRYVEKGVEAVDSANDARKADGVDAPTTKSPDSPQAPACKVNSFLPGTQVVLADGTSRAIEKLEAGDLVVATDPETGDTRARQVTGTRNHEGSKELVTLTVDSGGKGKALKLTSTAAHLYWLPDFGTWVPAKDLESGMWLQTSAGTWVQISAVDTAHRSARVYNLSVEGVHTYYGGHELRPEGRPSEPLRRPVVRARQPGARTCDQEGQPCLRARRGIGVQVSRGEPGLRGAVRRHVEERVLRHLRTTCRAEQDEARQ
ncbi:polymorphic toxin-type HINT domain-containing protein [Streptomyces albogriseolus]|uniref:polymorphic toxin-type HINT domain-containing protein n=1 Tax=Streptomyces albogriseolus TaxID=1887 RepID=UPI00345F6459